jgi:hypothetical protein
MAAAAIWMLLGVTDEDTACNRLLEYGSSHFAASPRLPSSVHGLTIHQGDFYSLRCVNNLLSFIGTGRLSAVDSCKAEQNQRSNLIWRISQQRSTFCR